MIRYTLLVMTLLLFSGVVVAQNEKLVELYLATGTSFPTRDFDIQYNHGYNGSVGIGCRIANNFRVVTKAEIQTFAFDQTILQDSVSGGDYTAIMTGVDLRWYKDIPGWGLDPMLLIGGGVAFSWVSALTIGSVNYDATHEIKPYVNIGAGIDVQLTPKISGFLTGRYVRISSGGTKAEFYPINVGIRF